MPLIAIDGVVFDYTEEEFEATCETPTLEQRREQMRVAVGRLLDNRLSAGFPYDFGGDIGIKILQTRNLEDRTNWLISQASYSSMVAMGNGAVAGANFRTADNINIELTFEAGLTVLLTMAAWGDAHYQRSWELKDAIAGAADDAALDLIDIESGWPG